MQDSIFSPPAPNEINNNIPKWEEIPNPVARQPRSQEPIDNDDDEDDDYDYGRNATARLCSGNYCLDAGYDKLSRPWVSDPDTGEKSPIRVGVSIDELRIQDIQV